MSWWSWRILGLWDALEESRRLFTILEGLWRSLLLQDDPEESFAIAANAVRSSRILGHAKVFRKKQILKESWKNLLRLLSERSDPEYFETFMKPKADQESCRILKKFTLNLRILADPNALVKDPEKSSSSWENPSHQPSMLQKSWPLPSLAGDPSIHFENPEGSLKSLEPWRIQRNVPARPKSKKKILKNPTNSLKHQKNPAKIQPSNSKDKNPLTLT